MDRRAVSSEAVFVWPIDSSFGWGIRGLNVALSWDGIAVSAMPEGRAELPPGDPRQGLLDERLVQSRRFRDRVLSPLGDTAGPTVPVLVAMGNDLTPQRAAFGKMVRGRPTIACPVFEDVASVERNIENLRGYDAVVVASAWNRDVLAGLGVASVVCHEGIDQIIFNPGVRAAHPRTGSAFRVFSGGKAEWRKGQDIVIEAFKLFAEKHDDAVLVAAWGSPFGFSGQDFEGRWEYGAPPGSHIGRPNFHAWVERAGIKPHQFEYVEPRANWRMAEVYAGCDVAVFPNRCEGGTNFPLMEAMACGVPTIVRLAYGQDDLADDAVQFGYVAMLDGPELVAGILDEAYYGPKIGDGLGDHWTWDRHCREMAGIIASV